VTLNVQPGFLWNDSTWNPSMISTALWLDAADASTVTLNGSSVSQWNDKSGNGRNLTQGTSANQPLYVTNALNGKPKLNFGTTDFLVNSSYGGWANSSFFVAAICNLDNATLPAFPAIISENNSSSAGYLAFGSNNTTPRKIAISRTGQATTSSTFNFPRNSWGILGFQSALGITGSSGSGTVTLTPYLDGTSAADISIGSLLTTSISTIVGASRLGAQDILDGSLAEVIVSPASLSSLYRQKLEGYLAHKWGLEANLPVGHPYKTTGPTP
jgi:hypothetical protein